MCMYRRNWFYNYENIKKSVVQMYDGANVMNGATCGVESTLTHILLCSPA